MKGSALHFDAAMFVVGLATWAVLFVLAQSLGGRTRILIIWYAIVAVDLAAIVFLLASNKGRRVSSTARSRWLSFCAGFGGVAFLCNGAATIGR